MQGVSKSNRPFAEGLTRRRFLQVMAAVGGAGAVATSMHGLGMYGQIAAQTEPPELKSDGRGKKVIVLGGGPAGCTTAYELMNRGYDVTLIEPLNQLGGHVLTIRKGKTVHEYGGEEQTCDWDDGNWYDAGASRIPAMHRAILHYCRELHIPMSDHKNLDLNSWVYMQNIDGPLNGTKMRLNELQTDMGGYTSELLAKAADQQKLDEPFTNEDRDMLIEYLVNWGVISPEDLTYTGSERRGYAVLPNTEGPGVPTTPFSFKDLLPFARATLTSQNGYLGATATSDWQETLMKPKDGMDAIYNQGFGPALGDRVKLNCKATEIRQDDHGVRVVYEEMTTGETEEITGDYLFCNIPLSVLMNIPADFSPEMRDAIQHVPYVMAGRAGAQFNRRFWEEDDWIYGGQSFTNDPKIGIVTYPDDGYFTKTGTMLVYYNRGAAAAEVSGMNLAERQEMVLSFGEKLHPTFRKDFHSMMSVSWHRMPHRLGGWPSYTPVSRANYFPRLQEPDGRIYLIGEHLSFPNGWQEAAYQSAWMQLEKFNARMMSEA